MICFDTQNAEDVLQEALADVYKRWSKIREHENPEAYLMRVMVSRHADMRRKWLRKQQEKETNLREIAKIMEMPMGTVASHFARGKAAVAAYVELTPELERSTGRELTNKSRNESDTEIVVAEVVDNNE
jgi:DNA-directed RNA polymerase specialized sigma24 family protein